MTEKCLDSNKCEFFESEQDGLTRLEMHAEGKTFTCYTRYPDGVRDVFRITCYARLAYGLDSSVLIIGEQ